MNHRPHILVLGAGGPAAANFIDALRLSATPYYLVGCDVKPYHLELPPLDARYVVSRPDGYERYLTLCRIIHNERIDFIHAQPDVEVMHLVEFSYGGRTWLPSRDALDICADKWQSRVLWMAAGVPTADAVRGDDADGISGLVDKHNKVWVRATRGAGSRASLPCRTADQVVAWMRYWREEHDLDRTDFMVSEFLPGPEYAFQSLWRRGRLLVSAARERLEYVFGNLMPSGQSSSPSVARSVHNDEVNRVAQAAVLAIDHDADGVFCVDLKTAADRTVRATEVNAGRFFTTSNFFAHAGCNMPDIYVRMGLGDETAFEGLSRVNAVPAGLVWVRHIDMGYKLLRTDSTPTTKETP
jgi:carbamoyl-phosphate synthase large subunit